ncbi:MAG: DUF4091 domain-containing protein [Verrucomicrobiae bacterium]|nr:DUF4091 domain-containing protein [Verrucomicrobiae bacterium]
MKKRLRRNSMKGLCFAFLTIFILVLRAEEQDKSNFLGNPSFENGLASWNAREEGDVKIRVDTTVCREGGASLLFEDKGRGGYATVVEKVRLKEGRSYLLSFHAKGGKGWCDGISLNFPGIKKAILPWYPLKVGEEWKRYEHYFIAARDEMTVCLCPVWGGKIWYDDFCIVEAGLPSNAVARGNRVFNFQPRNPMPDAPVEWDEPSKRLGLVTYVRDPRDVYPDSIPQRSELAGDTHILAAPGEQESAYFSIHALAGLDSVKVSSSDLVGKKGGRIRKDCVEIRFVKCWPQRTAWNSFTYYIIPELLEKKDRVNIGAGISQTVFLTVNIPSNVPADDYSTTLTVLAGGLEKARMNLRVRVLPFRLETPPDVSWEIYWDHRLFPVAAWETVLRDMKEHGANCAWFPLSRFKPDGFVLDWSSDNKRVTGFQYDKLAEFLKLRKKVGLKGRLVLSEGGWSFPLAIKEHLGLKFTKSPNPADSEWPGEELEQPWFKQLYQDICVQLDKFVRENGGDDPGLGEWYLEGVDEPGQFPARRRLALYGAQMAKSAGLKTLSLNVANAGAFISKLAPFVDVMNFDRDFAANAKRNEECLALAKEKGFAPWFYGSGCYAGGLDCMMQEGGLTPNRWYSGFLLWKSKAKGHGIWNYAEKKPGDPYDDFDNSDAWEPKDAFLVYPDKDRPGEIISTLQWEGVREGIKDYKYLHTLSMLIGKCKTSSDPKIAAKASGIEAGVRRLIEDVPWLDDYSCKDFTDRTANEMRSRIAGWILELSPSQPLIP